MPAFTVSTALAVGSFAVGAIGAGVQISAMRKADKQASEAKRLQTAAEQVRDRTTRRRAAREERIRRARLINASSQQGTSGSSAEIGAGGALSSNFASAQARMTEQGAFSTGISGRLQSAADSRSRARNAAAWTDTIQSGLGLADTIWG